MAEITTEQWKAVTKRLSLTEEALEIQDDLLAGLMEAVRLISNRLTWINNTAEAAAFLIEKKPRVLPSSISHEDAPWIWKASFDFLSNEEKAEMLRRLVIVQTIRKNRLDRLARKLAREAKIQGGAPRISP